MIGTVLNGKYKIIDLIGSGGMANVYKATQLETGAIVAVKILKDEFAMDAEFVRRFRSEAQAVLHLSHENIVRLVDVGKDQEKNYIVFEYIDGYTLKELIAEKNALSRQQVIEIAMQLCDALSHAHERNIIHRDVKPQNALLDEHGKVRIADFGIARRADATTMTFSGTNILGSVHYISPEQARGEQVDAKSDIYSLGIVLYEMATGKLPFDSENTLSVAIMHIQEEITPPIKCNPQIGKALNNIIIKATDKDKRKRYQSTRELKRDLIRAIKEPDGNFVRVEKTRHTERKNSSMFNILKLALIMIIAVGTLTALFIIGTTIINNNRQANGRMVPSLIGKTEQAAKIEAERMGFRIQVRSNVMNENYPKGVIFNQEPKAASAGKQDEIIFVDISAGSSTITAPNVMGIMLDEATQIITDWGLQRGEIVYEYNEAPEGTVINQMPEPNTPLLPGDFVDLVVSGEEGEREIMPTLVDKNVHDAIELASGAGFKKVLIRELDPEQDVAPGMVISQMPASGEPVLRDQPIEIWIARIIQCEYTLEVAYNVDVPRNGLIVMITVRKGMAEYIVYEQEMSEGNGIPIPLTIESEDNEPAEVVIYVGGEEIRKVPITFSPRS